MSLTLDLFVQASVSSLRALAEQSLSSNAGSANDESEEVGIGIYLKPSDDSSYLMVGGVHPKGSASTLHGSQINIGDLLIAVTGIDVANQDVPAEVFECHTGRPYCQRSLPELWPRPTRRHHVNAWWHGRCWSIDNHYRSWRSSTCNSWTWTKCRTRSCDRSS